MSGIGFAPTRTAAPFSPVEWVPQVYFAGAPSAVDCCAQVAGLMEFHPTWRAEVGSLLVWCDDESFAPWQRPWISHAWLVDPNGRIHDSAVWNLEKEARLSRLLPKDIPDLMARVIPHGPQQEQEVRALLATRRPSSCPSEQLVYVPGCVFVDSEEELNNEDVAFWAAVARASVQRGGFNRDEFRRLMRAPSTKQEGGSNV